jgi:hypothetical protein
MGSYSIEKFQIWVLKMRWMDAHELEKLVLK